MAYCGSTGAFAYKEIEPAGIDRVFVLGPSHKRYFTDCALPSGAIKAYDTPLGPFHLDKNIIAELHETGLFSEISKEIDEREHSIEMHLPWISFVMKGHEFELVPVLVGDIEDAKLYGSVFARYLQDSRNLFVISSDFCH